MEEELMFRIIFVIAFAIFASIRIYFRSQTIGRESEREETLFDRPTIFLSVVIISFFGIMFLYILLPDWIFWAHLDIHVFIRWLGVVLGFVGIILLFWIHRTLGKQYSAKLEIQKGHELITTGPYKRIRHPMYTVFMTFTIGASLMTANGLMIILSVLLAIPFHWITRKEEKMLTEQFGEDYQKYMDRTGRFLPRVRRKD
ncbi:MAG: methyltransferase [Candidatus Thorarchaeota archaeon]